MIVTIKRVVCDNCSAFSTAALESEDVVTVARNLGWAVGSHLEGGFGPFRYGPDTDNPGADFCPKCHARNIQAARQGRPQRFA